MEVGMHTVLRLLELEIMYCGLFVFALVSIVNS